MARDKILKENGEQIFPVTFKDLVLDPVTKQPVIGDKLTIETDGSVKKDNEVVNPKTTAEMVTVGDVKLDKVLALKANHGYESNPKTLKEVDSDVQNIKKVTLFEPKEVEFNDSEPLNLSVNPSTLEFESSTGVRSFFIPIEKKGDYLINVTLDLGTYIASGYIKGAPSVGMQAFSHNRDNLISRELDIPSDASYIYVCLNSLSVVEPFSIKITFPRYTLKDVVDSNTKTILDNENKKIDVGRINHIKETYIDSPNLFNKDTVIEGGYFDINNIWIDDANYVSSDFIPVVGGRSYKKSHQSLHTLYNSYKGFITSSNDTIFNVSSARFIKIRIKKTDVDRFMVTLTEDFPASYKPFPKTVYEVDTDYIKSPYFDAFTSPNLFNKDVIIEGGYFDINNIWIDDANYVSSDFIPVMPGVYDQNIEDNTYVLFTDSKDFIEGVRFNKVTGISIKSAKYIKIQIPVASLAKYMFGLRDAITDEYVPYGAKYKLKEYIYIPNIETNNNNNDTPSSIDSVSLKATKIAVSGNGNAFLNVLQNKLEAVPMVLEDWSGYEQPWHPSVIYVKNGFAGYKYWMSQTPWPIGGVPSADRWECPVVYKSNDGIDWDVIPSANPLDDLIAQEITDGGYFSDSHILYRSDLNRIEVWYRITPKSTTKPDGGLTNLIRRTTTDGITWTPREELHPFAPHTTINNHRSPSIIWDEGLELYRMWYTSNPGKYYRTSPNGTDWSVPEKMTFDRPTNGWHIDVNYYRGIYHYVGYDSVKQLLDYYISENGLDFYFVKNIINSNSNTPLYGNGLYRAISMVDENDNVRLYSSGHKLVGDRGVFMMIADSLEDMTDQIKISNNIIGE